MLAITANSDLERWIGECRAVAAQAVTAATKAAADGLRNDLRQQLSNAGFKPTLGNMIGSAGFPRGKHSIGAAATVYARGEMADMLLSAFSDGVVITANNARYLCFPTGFNAMNGWRGRGAGEKSLRVTPDQMKASGRAFVVRTKRGNGLLWCLPVAEPYGPMQPRTKRYLVAGGGFQVATGNTSNRRLPVKQTRTQWLNALLAQGFVPMFFLMRSVNISQSMTPDELARSWGERIPILIERALPGLR